jgi:MFS family permease
MKKSFLKPDINNWVVLWTSVGVNLVAGILYVWSIINKGLVTELGWTSTQASLPYTIASLSFVLSMIFFGKIMDVRGPRICVVASGILAGIGLILSGIFIRVPWLVALLFMSGFRKDFFILCLLILCFKIFICKTLLYL